MRPGWPSRRAEIRPAEPTFCTMPHPAGIGWRHPHYAQVLEERPALDFLEVHSENFFGEGGAAIATLMQARVHYPVSLHGVGLGLGSAVGIDAGHLDQLARLVDRVDPVRVSDHACFARGMGRDGAIHAADLLPLPFNRQALDVLCANVQQVQDRLKRPLLVENLSAYLDWASSDQPEPEFLAALARRTGCQLLVDVNNIYVNALNAQPDAQLPGGLPDPLQACRDWLAAIPADAVGELHVAGHCRVSDAQGDIVIDDHGSRACDAVWQLHAEALRRFGPVPTLVEWDTDIPPLAVLLDEAARARRSVARPQAALA